LKIFGIHLIIPNNKITYLKTINNEKSIMPPQLIETGISIDIAPPGLSIRNMKLLILPSNFRTIKN
jgi:hypothetical protein